MTKTIFEEYEYTICKHFICAIEYGDYSALNDEEIKQLDDFLESLPGTHVIWNWGDNDDCNFARCEICRLMGDCVEVTLLVKKGG